MSKYNIGIELVGGPMHGKKWRNLLTKKIAEAIIGGMVPKGPSVHFPKTFFTLLQNEDHAKMTYRVVQRLPNKIVLEYIGE